ncbi:hypothetical protein ACNKHR_05365 [Shigella flexneri]
MVRKSGSSAVSDSLNIERLSQPDSRYNKVAVRVVQPEFMTLFAKCCKPELPKAPHPNTVIFIVSLPATTPVFNKEHIP